MKDKMSRYIKLVMEGINNFTKLVATQSALLSPDSIHISRTQPHTANNETLTKPKDNVKIGLHRNNESFKKILFT